MGGAVSTGQDNDDLIDNLLEADYIRTPIVEKVFRAVDRGEYFLPASRVNAYKDLAWKSGNLHLSAPCIYSEVMEGLCLSPGLSFLNLGSGTGYLSTMVGLILGSYGINHGVEIHQDVIQFATKKLEEFKKYSGAIDEYDFCEPKFIQGNCLCLTSDTRQYDRIYCGAACPESHETYMRDLLKVGGILVMPLNDQLLQIKRVTEVVWDRRILLPVSFATLIQPQQEKQDTIIMMDINPLPLQALCRTAVLHILRRNIEHQYPNLKPVSTAKKVPKKKRALRRLVVPLFDTSDESSDDDNPIMNHNRDMGRVSLNGGGENNTGNNNQNREQVNTLIDFVLGRLRERRNNSASTNHQCVGTNEVNSVIGPPIEQDQNDRFEAARLIEDQALVEYVVGNKEEKTEEVNKEDFSNTTVAWDLSEANRSDGGDDKIEEKMEVDSGAECNENQTEATGSRSTEVKAVIEHQEDEAPVAAVAAGESSNYGHPIYEHLTSTDVINGIEEVLVGVLNGLRNERDDSGQGDEKNSEAKQQEVDVNKASTSVNETNEVVEDPKNVKTNAKREKFDSGLGDEIIERDADSDLDDVMEMELDSYHSSDENNDERPTKRGGSRSHTEVRTGGKWRRITLANRGFDDDSSSESETGQEELNTSLAEFRVLISPYTPLMKSKIQALPLPPVLKNYLNFYRKF